MYKNILVINTMHIGDLMLVTPALRTLRTNYPKAHIALLTDKSLGDLVRCNENIDECILIDKHGKDKGFLALVRFIQSIRRKHFDLVINLHRNERASAIAAFSGGKRIVGYAQPFFKRFFDCCLPNLAMADTPKELAKHQVTSHLEVLQKAAGCTKIDDRGLEMWLPPEEEKKAADLWAKEFAPEDRVIAMNIGASWLTKRWIDSYFAECADRLIREGYHIAFLGGPTDLSIVETCIGLMKEKDRSKVHVFTGKVSLTVLAGLLRRVSLLITTDSGPMHVGVAMNAPIVTMFGASPVPTFYPYDGKAVLIKTPEPCHPCGIHDCPHKGDGYMACMKHIPVDTVMKYCEELLAAYGGKQARELPPHPGDYQCRVIEKM
jgi:heptosyltransferase II